MQSQPRVGIVLLALCTFSYTNVWNYFKYLCVLDTLAILRKPTVSFVMYTYFCPSVSLSVRPHGNKSTPAQRTLKCDIPVFSEHMSSLIKIWQ